MKVIIAGSRTITKAQFDTYLSIILADNHIDITTVVSGTAKGPDTFAIEWAVANGIPVVKFPANWAKFGRSAGICRNWDMAEYADAAIVLWDGESRGSQHMIRAMKKLGKPCHYKIIQ